MVDGCIDEAEHNVMFSSVHARNFETTQSLPVSLRVPSTLVDDDASESRRVVLDTRI